MLPVTKHFKTMYKCRDCGATSYQRVVDRAQNGVLQPTGAYRCTGCRTVFSCIRSWCEPHRSHGFRASTLSG